ncbi:hypothetical protein [Campylobacter jejuni]|uniref:hypothetical protein n=1 Tax=Campylobacter jejuni TaxID=197 RepID=UPI001F093412|nr:hypothetical protein [Campylobacter jejuni]MCH3850361.1 hypothetical protein [Campylobacter jejuni]WLR37517.1 hypothetical protein P3305_07075 [Campylobacter jejuni]WLR44619.1 hypothetical protein P3306_05010 [Campylobacter jejuni]HEG3374226.1 hypothetical protein [Campylobacter jejuni]
MHRLDVPPVELVARKYELEQKFKVKLSIENVVLFNELEKKIDALAFNTTTIINNVNNTILSRKKQNIENLNYQIQFKTAKARIQNHLSYKLGQAFIKSSKTWYKKKGGGGYVKFIFEIRKLKK